MVDPFRLPSKALYIDGCVNCAMLLDGVACSFVLLPSNSCVPSKTQITNPDRVEAKNKVNLVDRQSKIETLQTKESKQNMPLNLGESDPPFDARHLKTTEGSHSQGSLFLRGTIESDTWMSNHQVYWAPETLGPKP